MVFWRDALGAEPKREHRFLVRFVNSDGGNIIEPYYASKIQRPEITITTAEHKYLGHTYKFPGNAEWNNIEAEFVDVDKSAGALLKRLRQSGYNPPPNPGTTTTISKDKAVNALGTVKIISLAANSQTAGPASEPATGGAAKEIDSFILKNAWINKLKFGDFDYESDKIMKITVTFSYDWAEYNNEDGVIWS